MHDQIIAWIRTAVPTAVGAVLTWLARTYGVILDDATTVDITIAATFVASIAFYSAAKALEARWPAAGRLLGVAKAPTYTETEAAVRERIRLLAALPLPAYEAAIAADPTLLDDDHRDGCTDPTHHHATPLAEQATTDARIVLDPTDYDPTT